MTALEYIERRNPEWGDYQDARTSKKTLLELMRGFAELKCKEQREICSRKVVNHMEREHVLNAKTPQL